MTGSLKRLLQYLWRRLKGEAPSPAEQPAAPRPKAGLQRTGGPPPLTPPPASGAGAGTPPPTSRRAVASARVPLSRGERSIIVGVDFGTSSTKVIWQDLSDNHFEIVRWDSAEEGLPASLLPSAMVIRGELLHFGLRDHELTDGDIRLSSVKLCVLCRSNPAICRCGNALAKHGVVRLPGQETTARASAFACLLLAHVFQDVERRLAAQFPDDDLVLLWNVGCPMDHLDQADRKSEWERMAGVAMDLRERMSNPASLSMLREVDERLDGFSVPDQSERNYFVQPEGLAAVKAFLESPHAESKTYAIVDVGAGTTEVSFFFNGRIMTEPGQPLRPSYLADSTRPVGGRKIDLELAAAWNCDAEEARRKKEAGATALPAVKGVSEICAQYERTCGEVWKSNKLSAPSNKRFDLFVIGGGGRLQPLQETLRARALPGGFVREGWHQLQPPRKLNNRTAVQGHYDFLANACGLASSLSWEYYPPREVSSMPPPPPPKPKPDLEEYYPK